MKDIATPEHLGGLLTARAEATPDRPYLTCRDVEYTYSDMASVVDRVAAGLQSLGIKKGSVVAVLSAGRREYVELYLACVRIGAIEVPLNAFLKGEFLRYQLDNSQAVVIAADSPGVESVAPLLAALPELGTVIAFDPLPEEARLEGRRAVQYTELQASGAPLSIPDMGPDDLLSLLYTSGTTGLPKGCMIPHGYALRLARHSSRVLELEPDDYVYALGPLFHASGQMGVTTPLVMGHRVAVEPEFSASGFARRIGELGVTAVSGVGAHAPLILAQPRVEAERHHQVRAMFFAPCPKAARDELSERYGVKVTAMLYGQTECVPLTYSPLSDAANTTNLKSCGRPAPDLDVRIVADDGQPVSTGQTGEIIVKPKAQYGLFAGYWRNQEATEKAFAGGWYHTGDAGILEDDGSLTFMDRKKDVIRRRGENISSLEVETAILALPKIADVAVFAVPSGMIEDEVMATIKLDEGEKITPDELFAMFRRNLPYFAIPRYVDIGAEIPRNALNRVMKSNLKDRGVTSTTLDFESLGLVVERANRRTTT